MPAPTTVAEFLGFVEKSGVADRQRLENFLHSQADSPEQSANSPADLAEALTRDGVLTQFQASQLLRGKWRHMLLCGKYTILEPIGAGGMGNVYLCAHKIMKRLVAIKVLPTAQGGEPAALERFHREARAVAGLRHPNIAVAHDVDQDGPFHFLVMEYVDGCSLQQLVSRSGPLDPVRAAHYVHQAALGLQHAHEAGVVHRDVKPANLILDREGTVKVLDLGLARFFHDKTDSLTKHCESGALLGTVDYLAPEQAIDSHHADARSDVYSLGLTFYFLLAGRNPVPEGSVPQKLLWHQMREPAPIREVNPQIPEGLAAVLDRMLTKNPSGRYPSMAAVAEALAPWTATPIAPPAEEEIPRRSASLRCAGLSDTGLGSGRSPGSDARPPVPARPVTPQPAPPLSGSPTHVSPRTPPPPPADDCEPTLITGGSSDCLPETVSDEAPADQDRTAVLVADPPEKAEQGRRSGVPGWLWGVVGGSVAAVVLLAAGIAAGFLWFPPRPVAVAPADGLPALPAGPVSAPAPATPAATATASAEVKRPAETASARPTVAIRREFDGFHVQAPHYEAVVDGADGCLASFRVAGVEFFKNGIPLARGKTTSRGGYFYSEKDGNQGLVSLPRVEQAGNVVTATGDKFIVSYTFTPDALTVKAQNSTDDTVPYYLILDSERARAVIDGQGQRHAVPVPLTQKDKIDPRWRTSTWVAGQARLKVTDQTPGAATRLWGPWSEFDSQVWETPVTTYNHCLVTLEPGVGPVEPVPQPPAGQVVLTREGPARHVRTDLYEAVVAEDGCMPSLRIDGVEMFRAGVSISRGLYFLQGKTLALPELAQPTPNSVTARGEQAAIRYDFEPGKMKWTVENRTAKGMNFFAVFDPAVVAVQNGQGEWEKSPSPRLGNAPIDARWGVTTWYAGPVKLKLTGGNRIWGPWEKHYQVWEAYLKPKESRVITAEVGRTDADEASHLAQLTGKPVPTDPGMVLSAPLDYEVYQRRTRVEGPLTMRGRVRAEYDRLEYRLQGLALAGTLPAEWREVPLGEKGKSFEATVSAPAGGWYRLEVRAKKGEQVVAARSVEHVGVGEVFVGAGQSNSTNCGQERINPTSGLVSTFSGQDWRLADDPQPGVHDNSTGGSYWPAFGDEMAARYRVPIGVASTGHSGTSINRWQPGSDLFRWTTRRMQQLGPQGFRAVLWHQGESDVGMSAEEYAQKLERLIAESRRAAGWEVPWFVAQVSYHNPGQPSFATARAGQKQVWEDGAAFAGPDTDTLQGDNRDQGGKGIHFSPKGLRAHGKLWADRVSAYLDRELLP